MVRIKKRKIALIKLLGGAWSVTFDFGKGGGGQRIGSPYLEMSMCSAVRKETRYRCEPFDQSAA